MPQLSITPNLDLNPWTDIKPDQMIPGDLQRIGLLPAGMASGKASVAMVVTTPDGRPIIVQTSWAIFHAAARALAASPVAEMEDL